MKRDVIVVQLSPYDRELHAHVYQLLEQHGIRADIHGSVVYGVLVSAEDAQKAREILRPDAAARGYQVVGR